MKATKEHILSEIRRLAAGKSGRPPGIITFKKETGIPESVWQGIYWARWSDAVAAAGCDPNLFQRGADEEFIMERLAKAVRHYRHIPGKYEIQLYRNTKDKEIPTVNNLALRFGGMMGIFNRLAEYVQGRPEHEDVAAILADRVAAPISKKPRTTRGYVYLIKSGTNYKIGRTGNLERRMGGLALPDEKEIVWKIETDDPVGIEAYWHNRFEDRKVRSEWFKLTAEDVKAFKRWKKIV